MAPKLIRRPAAAVKAKAKARGGRPLRPGRRRPAAEGEAPLHPVDLQVGDLMILDPAHYYGKEGQVAGRLLEEKLEDGRRMLDMEISGTTLDGLLVWATQGLGPCQVHLCGPECLRELEGEGLVHATKSRVVTPKDLEGIGWATNVQVVIPAEEDQNAGLRRRLEKLERNAGIDPGDKKEDQREKEEEKKRKKEKEDKKKKKKTRRSDSRARSRSKGKLKDKRRRSSSAASAKRGRGTPRSKEGKEKKRTRSRSSSTSSSDIGEGQVSQRRMFRGTALDVSAKKRRKVRRRAQKFLKKKRSSSSASSESEGSREEALGGSQSSIFGDELKVRGLAERFPGLLSAESMLNIRRMVMTDMGDQGSSGRGWPPLLVRYYRQVLSRRISGAMGREMLTHCSVIDALLEGKIAVALDVALQRIKGLELQSQGTSYLLSQRLEVLPSEVGVLPSRQEMAIITRERNQEAKAFGGSSYQGAGSPGKGKYGPPQEKGQGKGKDKSKSKNKDTRKGEDQKKNS
eukprot:s167_g3.t1